MIPASNPAPALTPDHPRLGFCCQWLPPDGDEAAKRRMNIAHVTMANLGKLEPAERTAKLLAIVAYNVEVLERQVENVAARPPIERLLRLVSQLLPGYTHPTAAPVYAEPAMREIVEPALARIGVRARAAGVRLSLHPGPFCILATVNPGALKNAVEDFEYHTHIMRLLGLTGGWHPWGTHINIHGGAKAAGLEMFRAHLPLLSEEARGLITIENDETSYGLDAVLTLADALPIVMDLHHHWCASGGDYVLPDDPRVERIKASWRGTRPVGHVSLPREDLFLGDPPTGLPDHAFLTSIGVKGRDLMAHSDFMWNAAMDELLAGHLAWTDYEIEAKAKNLASEPLARRLEARLGLGSVARAA